MRAFSCNRDVSYPVGLLCDVSIQATQTSTGGGSGIMRFDTQRYPGGIRYKINEVAFVGQPWNAWCVNGDLLQTSDPTWSRFRQAFFYFQDGDGVTTRDLHALLFASSPSEFKCGDGLTAEQPFGFMEYGDFVVTVR